MRSVKVLSLAAILSVAMVGCDEPAYEGGVPQQQATTPEPDSGLAPSGPAFQTGSGSTYGGAMKAARGVAGRVGEQQQRTIDEIPD